MTALWVVVACITLLVGFFGGWVICLAFARRGPCNECREWIALADHYEVELAKADKALADIPNVFLAGQVFQAERKDAGL